MSRVLNLITAAHGQCRLVFVSATQLRLDPHNGRNLAIGGMLQQVPVAGVTISNSGLAANTVYYVYAWMNGATMALELSTTGRATDDYGVQIKSGDGTRTLVGMCRTNGSSQFVDSATQRFVINWFNRRIIAGASPTTIGNTSNTAVLTEINTAARVEFLSWADEWVEAFVIGSVSNSSSGNVLHTTSPGVDAAAGAQTTATTFTNGVSFPAAGSFLGAVSEGYHFASAWGQVAAGTGTWNYGVQLKTRG